MNRFRQSVLVLFLIFISLSFCKAQDSISLQTPDTIRVEGVPDTIISFKHSPTRAAVLSAVLPGMGQVYNKKFWKVPLIYGGLITTGYFINHWNKSYQLYLKALIEYRRSGKDINSLTSYNFDWVSIPGINIDGSLSGRKDQYRNWRDLNVLIMAGVYFLNIIDATVDAYLFNYDISDDLSLRIEPAVLNLQANQGGAFGLKLSFNFR